MFRKCRHCIHHHKHKIPTGGLSRKGVRKCHRDRDGYPHVIVGKEADCGCKKFIDKRPGVPPCI